MIPPDEQRHLERGPMSGEAPGGAGLVEVVATTATDPAPVLRRAGDVVLAVLALPASAWEEPDSIGAHLPVWFVEGCAPEQSQEELTRWVTWWQSLPADEQARAEADQPWALSDWLHWMEPHERTWFWWDARVAGEGEARVSVEVPGWPSPLGALDWLLRVAGAVRTETLEPSF